MKKDQKTVKKQPKKLVKKPNRITEASKKSGDKVDRENKKILALIKKHIKKDATGFILAITNDKDLQIKAKCKGILRLATAKQLIEDIPMSAKLFLLS